VILRKFVAGAWLIFFAFAAQLAAQGNPEWTNPFPPHHIAGNLYYVGSEDLASYLITTPKGHILINSSLESSPALIRKSVETLGFHFGDIKILLISHAHYDHCAGSAMVKKLTGARYFVMDADVPVVESGGRTDFQYGARKDMRYPPTHVDRVLHDGDTVRLGGAVLVAHLTAGHTKGTTTWTMDEKEGGKTLHVVIVGSPNVNPGYKLVGNKTYPRIAIDYRHGFRVLKALPCDIFLGAHGGYYGMKAKYERWKQGDHDAFIDPQGYGSYIDERQQAFEAELKRQEAERQKRVLSMVPHFMPPADASLTRLDSTDGWGNGNVLVPERAPQFPVCRLVSLDNLLAGASSCRLVEDRFHRDLHDMLHWRQSLRRRLDLLRCGFKQWAGAEHLGGSFELIALARSRVHNRDGNLGVFQ
jgi:metallo-beta-lactamase class B